MQYTFAFAIHAVLLHLITISPLRALNNCKTRHRKTCSGMLQSHQHWPYLFKSRLFCFISIFSIFGCNWLTDWLKKKQLKLGPTMCWVTWNLTRVTGYREVSLHLLIVQVRLPLRKKLFTFMVVCLLHHLSLTSTLKCLTCCTRIMVRLRKQRR